MLSDLFLLLLGGTLFSLRVSSLSGSFPRPLSAEEEETLLLRSISGDLEARNKLIEHNLRLVAHIIKKFYVSEADQEDLVSIGTIGLIKGITSYRPDKGVRLATYASRCIENEILMYFRSLKKSSADISLSDSIDSDGEANTLTLIDTLADETDMAETIGNASLCANLHTYIDKYLSDTEKKVIVQRFGLGGNSPLTQKEVAEELAISRSYVSRIEKRALEKLRAKIEEE